MVGSNDIARSKRFYDAVLAVLGAGEAVRNEAPTGDVRLFNRHVGGSFGVTVPINGEAAMPANGGTVGIVGFKCASPEQVRQFHDVALAHGGVSIENAPGLRESTLGAMHQACVRDPDGNKLCAVCRGRSRAGGIPRGVPFCPRPSYRVGVSSVAGGLNRAGVASAGSGSGRASCASSGGVAAFFCFFCRRKRRSPTCSMRLSWKVISAP